MKKSMKPFYSILSAIAIAVIGSMLSHVFAMAYILVVVGHYKLCVAVIALFKDPAFKATLGVFGAFAQAIKIVVYRIIAEANQIDAAQNTTEGQNAEEMADTAK